ncbi:MAG TPA: capreomycidine synthase [Pyrinomonadaceae bacterium]
MQIAPALLEYWLRQYYFDTEIDLGCSGVASFSMSELRELLGITQQELDAVVFRDSRTLGDPDLREAVARRWGGGDAERVMATHGSSEAIYLIMRGLLRPGDEVVVQSPAYQPLYSIAEAVGCRLRHWRLDFERGFVADMDELRALVNPKTRLIVANFPHNPTGATLTPAQQQELLDAASRVGAYVLWDAAFAELVHDGAPLPDPGGRYDRAITIGTLSKAYGLPGLRVGWCLAAPDVLEELIRLRDYITLHLSPLVELIGTRAVEKSDALLGIRLRQARANLDTLAGWIDEQGGAVEWVRPRGGVSVFMRLNGVPDVEGFCRRLAARHSVLLVPGTGFGQPRHVRLGFGGHVAEFNEGLARLSSQLRDESAGAG